MKKILCVCIAVIITFVFVFTFASCSEQGKLNADGTASGDHVVAVINGVKILRGEIEETIDDYLYPYNATQKTDAELETYRQEALQQLILQEILRQKAKELGYGDLTKEELEEVDKTYNKYYESMIDTFISVLRSEDYNNGVNDEVLYSYDYTEDAIKRFEEYLDEGKKYTLKRFKGKDSFEKQKESFKENYVLLTKLCNDIVENNVEITNKQIKDKYNSILSEQKSEFKSLLVYEECYIENLKSLIEDGKESIIFIYIPEGLRYIRNIKILFDESLIAELVILEDAMYTADDYRQSLKANVDAAQSSEDKTQAQKEYVKATADYNEAKAAYETKLNESSEAIADKMQEIHDKLKSGEDFIKVMQEYNMDNDKYYDENGFLIWSNSPRYPKGVISESMKLENPGDRSEIFYTPEGGNIVLYSSAIESKVVSMDDTKEDIKGMILDDVKMQEFFEFADVWTDEADLVRYDSVLIAPYSYS